MICKISRGDNPKRLMTYLFRPACFSKVYDISGKSPDEYAEMFIRHNKNRPTIKRPIYHLSVRLENHINPTDEEYHQLGIDVLDKMGLGTNRPFVIVKHDNEKGNPGTHIHIVTSRIDYNNKVWYGQHDAKQAIAVSRELGKPERFQLRDETIKPRVWSSSPSGRPEYTHGETQKVGRTKEWLPCEHVALGVALALRSVPRNGQEPLNKDFMKACAEHGITPKVITRTNGRQGLVYEFEGQDYASSKLGRAYTLTGLKKHFGSKGEVPAIELPQHRRESLRNKIEEACEVCPRKDRKEKQPIPTDNIYKMAKELENCEFDDLRQAGQLIQLQLDFKMMKKDVLGYMTCFAQLHVQDLENRRERAKYIKELRPQLIILRTEELNADDEYFAKQIRPRIMEHSTHEERGKVMLAEDFNENNRRQGYILQVANRNRATGEMRFLQDAKDYEIARDDLQRREAEFNKLPNFLKVFAPKHRGPDPESPNPEDFIKNNEVSDHERGTEWKKSLAAKFNEIAAHEREFGREISAHALERQRRRKLEQEEREREESARKDRERQQAEKKAAEQEAAALIPVSPEPPQEPTLAPAKPPRAPRPTSPRVKKRREIER